MTETALKLKIREQRREAESYFASNRYITIHAESGYDPFTVWVDLNYPIYVIRNGKPFLLENGIKNISITFPRNYPEIRPSVRCNSEQICSIHAWGNNSLCLHTDYFPNEHNLIKEICNLMALAANCPETINYGSPTPDMKSYIPWTKEALRLGIIPTVSYKRLVSPSPDPIRRTLDI